MTAMAMDGGISRGIDSAAASISKIEKALSHIDNLMGDIGVKSAGVQRTFQRSASGFSFGSGTSSVGAAAPLFGTGGAIPTPASSRGWMSTMTGGSVGGTMALGALGAAGGAAWEALPSVDNAISQRTAMFGATISYGSQMPNFNALKVQMNSAFGGYASSIASQENVANYMAGYGMMPGTGVSNNFMGQVSAGSLLTGQTDEAMAQGMMAVATPGISNNLLMYGIRTMDSKGNPLSYADIIKQLMIKQNNGRMPTVAELNQAVGPSGKLRQSFVNLLGPGQVDTAIRYAQAIAANGGNTNLNTSTAQGLAGLAATGATDKNRNPLSSAQSLTGAQSNTTSQYSDKLLAGWNAAITAAKAVESTLQDLKGVLGIVAQGKGFTQGMLHTNGGSALVNGLDTFGSNVGMLAAGSLLASGLKKGGAALLGGRAGSSLLSRLGMRSGAAAATEEAAAAAGGTGLLASAGRAGLGLAAGAGLAYGENQVFKHTWVTANSSLYDRATASLGHVALDAVTGAGTGLAAGGPIGAAVGAIAGAGYGAWQMLANGKGWNYGDNTSAGSLTGTPGGGGTSASSTSGGPAKNKAPSGASGAVAYAYEQVNHPTRNWYNMCDNFVARCYGRAYSGYYTASDHWKAIPAKLKHTDPNPPAGALVFWDTGAGAAGHVALGVGGGNVASTDILRRGNVDIVPVGEIAARWHVTYLGWTQPYFGGKIVAGGVNTPDASGQTNVGAASSGLSSTSAPGMTSTAVQPITAPGQSISADAYGGVTSSTYSLAGLVASSLASMMFESNATPVNMSPQKSTSKPGSAGTSASTNTPATAGGSAGAVGAYRAARGAGFSASMAELMTAISGAESGWNPSAVGDVSLENATWGPSVGLWQVRSLKSEYGTGQTRDETQLKNPTFNAHSAYDIFKQQGLQAWSTYMNGAYRQYLGQARAAEKKVDPNSVPAYATGAWKIGQDQLALIHKNEMILPESIADAVRSSVADSVTGQRSAGGTKRIDVHLHATGNLGYDAQQLIRVVKQGIENDSMISTIGRN